MSPVTVVAAVTGFLRGKNIEYLNTSPLGLALERIIEMFRGLGACTLFQNAAIRELLEELASGKSRVAAEVRGAIHKSLKGLSIFGQPATKEQLGQRVDSILDQAVEATSFGSALCFSAPAAKGIIGTR